MDRRSDVIACPQREVGADGVVNEHVRNSEGDVIELKDGRLLLAAYTHFYRSGGCDERRWERRPGQECGVCEAPKLEEGACGRAEAKRRWLSLVPAIPGRIRRFVAAMGGNLHCGRLCVSYA